MQADKPSLAFIIEGFEFQYRPSQKKNKNSPSTPLWMNTLGCLWSPANKHLALLFYSFAFINEVAVGDVASIVIILVLSQNFANITLALLALVVQRLFSYSWHGINHKSISIG